ncbi:MAG: hypothetical protein ABI910_23580 [Gemmatimonadota bacterium]
MNWRSPAIVIASVALASAACATGGGPRFTPPPHRFLLGASVDSARTLLRAVLEREGLVVDGSQTADANVVASTFVVRRGGMGEGEVRVRLRLSPESAGDSTSASVVLLLDATIRDSKRMMLMSPDDARSPRMSREPHPIQDNDRETLQRISRLEERLRQMGWTLVQER